ncbi:peptide-methionine (R)-S-oxide reductase [Helicobacter monodelphidis]|uniref:methionine-R-sulfoxide reductase n=1 Tax=Helicobacter sp. 15-1451 TaxID=2004995 RepID=UPI000DCECA10|nr:methionine-R-sulfoxide reductase [Helicobacter sp. 15-1451]RAX58409.1 peptide-methionine (R)-S-oxide reductase [Helicobacter sp. 15-1451]
MRQLTKEEEYIILHKGTEAPFSGEYCHFNEAGMYHCKQCDAILFNSCDKFPSHCGWPSFDQAVEGQITYQLDADGQRTEIVCKQCGGHLGHIFEGEGFTPKNRRYCVNSLSLLFKKNK